MRRKIKWRDDLKCGKYHPLADGKPAECDSAGDFPCCSDRYFGKCSTVDDELHCSCQDCIDYSKKWRDDGRCGGYFPLPDGSPAQCNPHGENPCCNYDWFHRECGNSAEHCACSSCVNYTRIYEDWEKSGGENKTWRYDGRCGRDHPLPDGSPAQCDPNGDSPCCRDDIWFGWCSNKPEDCNCQDCIDYSVTEKWIKNGSCGVDYPLRDGRPSECDPFGEYPCCSDDGRCSNTPDDCTCKNCVDYRLMIKWREDRICDTDDERYLDLKNFPGNPTPHSDYPDIAKSKLVRYRYEGNIFKCDNGKCVNYKQLCNRIDDCGDLSDELDCPQHMICENTRNSTNPKFLTPQRECDGKVDCFDWSDECNDSCGREILGSWMLKIICCFIGILAMAFNSVSVVHGASYILHDCSTENMLITKVLMSLIGSGDFLIGVYLIVLFIYDSLVYGSSYCQHQPEWLTGTPCMILGVISTVGSQLSLFSMTILSCIIMYGVVFKKMRISGQVTKKSLLKVSVLALTILSISLFIALVPLVHSLEDYFVQGIYYQSDTERLYGLPGKKEHAYIFMEMGQINNSRYFSWNDIRNRMDYMLRHHGDIQRRPVHFYGNDGVCLYKYFFRRDILMAFDFSITSQYRDQVQNIEELELLDNTREVTVWTMLTVNAACFIVITVCYIAITWKTRKSTQESGQHDNPDRLRENRAMQNRIILIIVTDFLCWVPFIIISGMHNLKYIDASNWYTPFALTVLPLNSVINPLLYDKIMLEFIKRRFGQLLDSSTNRLSHISFRSKFVGISRGNIS